MEKTLPDRRIQITKESLKKNLYHLLESTPIDKIMISDITELANVGRSTFYVHYKDVYSLLEDMEKDILSEYVINYNTLGFEESFLILCNFIKEHKNFVLAFHTPWQVGITSLQQKKALEATDLNSVYNQCLVEYMNAGNNHIIDLWIKSNFNSTPKEICSALADFTRQLLPLLKQ